MIRCRLGVILAQRRFEGQKPSNFTELSEATGIERATLSRLANNKTTRYSINTLERLCEVLEVGLGDLLVIQGDPLPPRKTAISSAASVRD